MTQKRGPFRVGTSPVASVIQCISPRLYSTLLPQASGRLTETALAHITGISPLRGSLRAARRQEYHYCWRCHCEAARHRLFDGRMDPLCTLLAVIDAGQPRAGGLRASSNVACRPRAARQRSYFSTGCDRRSGVCQRATRALPA